MSGALTKLAVAELIEKAETLGIAVPDEVRDIVFCGSGPHAGALAWLAAHPGTDEYDPDLTSCCWGALEKGVTGCTCWEDVFDVEQADPVPPASPTDLDAQRRMCGDCAYRKDSPERTDGYTEETLLALPVRGEPFWCHDGMRRPVVYRHPVLGDVPGDPDDWRPPMVGRVPFRADGRPGLLCAGWARLRIRETTRG